MLKRKLNQQKGNLEIGEPSKTIPRQDSTSEFFDKPLWLKFYETEVGLNEALEKLPPPERTPFIYNPIVYASQLHRDYLRRYIDGPKKLVFVGMNPGPNGMAQTGIPFGNVRTVKVLMQLVGSVDQPPVVHPKRPVVGLDCRIEEPSGVRLWELFLRLAGNMQTFSQQCFVHNFCPLAFFGADGRNITPSEIRGTYKKQLGDLCLQTLEEQLKLLKPEVIVAVGEYVHSALKRSGYGKTSSVSVFRLPHPSPRSPNNTNWPEKAQAFLEEHNLIRFMRNEA
ncbi:single-strand selective monofunctional uracil-DNA glycosylase [Drosophila sechellia]|uniref:GM15218 n=1 Tax=Drosophila sechellia TaxID=7238 RepID=B4IBK5_DROSE|nr:single-strand selective monofunctional uracil-DNA glycosylase [Drosophila sechellia]EDW44763.1 GM15218 [Drosophila sechellia]